MKLLLTAAAAACALAGAPAPVAAQRTTTYSEDCIGQRCVVRDRHGRRVATVTREPTGRLAVRDARGNLRAKVTKQGSRYRVERR